MWLLRPRVEIAKNTGKFLGFHNSLVLHGSVCRPEGCLIWTQWLISLGMMTAFTQIPAFRNACLADHWPPNQNSRDAGSYEQKNHRGPPPPGELDSPCFPLLIFSHRLGGTITTYSPVCGEFSSYRFVVVAIEHRDGSGPRMFVNLHPKFASENVDTTKTDRERGWTMINYVFPKNIARTLCQEINAR